MGDLPDSPEYAPADTPRVAKPSSEWVAFVPARYAHETTGRHEPFRSLCGHLLAKGGGIAPGVLMELAVCWAMVHIDDCPPRAELERNFLGIVEQEATKREPGPTMTDLFTPMDDYGSGDLRVTGADLSRSRPTRFAWDKRIAIGGLNLMIGNEGAGKGTLTAWLIAGLTRGELPGDLFGRPVGVAVLGDEDDFDSVWTPRLHAVGADLLPREAD